MTREETIKELQEMLKWSKVANQDREMLALSWAIEALSANYTTEKPNDVVEQKNDVVAEPTDLISRADAIEAVRKKLQDWGGYAFEEHREGLYEAIDVLESLPSADRPSGEWVDDDGNNVPLDKDGCPLRSCYCNQCHEWLAGSDEYYTKGNYCPNCGAEMKGEKL